MRNLVKLTGSVGGAVADVARALVVGLVLAVLFVAIAAALLFWVPVASAQDGQEGQQNPMPQRPYYDGVQDPRFSTAETARINDELGVIDDQVMELEARLEQLDSQFDSESRAARLRVRDELRPLQDRGYRLIEDLIERHTEAVTDYPVEGSPAERLEALRDQRDALESLSDYADERLRYDSPLLDEGAGPAGELEELLAEIESVEAEVEAQEEAEERAEQEAREDEAASAGDGGENGGNAAESAPAADPEPAEQSTSAGGGLNPGPLLLLALLVLAVAGWRFGWFGQAGSLFRRPLASVGPGPAGQNPAGQRSPGQSPPGGGSRPQQRSRPESPKAGERTGRERTATPPASPPPAPDSEPEPRTVPYPDATPADGEARGGESGDGFHPRDLLGREDSDGERDGDRVGDHGDPDDADGGEDDRLAGGFGGAGGGGGVPGGLPEGLPEDTGDDDGPSGGGGGRTSPLAAYTRDLTRAALLGELDPVVGREAEIGRVIRTLSRTTSNNPVLIGEAGVGKTAIAEGLAERISEGEVPVDLVGKRVLELDVGALEAGATMRGDFEGRLHGIIEEASARDDVLLFVDELHRLMYAGSHQHAASPGAQALKPALARGRLSMIGATTLEEFRLIEDDPAMARRFQPVMVEALGVEATVEVLSARREQLGRRIIITDSAIEAAAKLGGRYLTGRNLPGAAVDVLDEAGAALRTFGGGRRAEERSVLTAADVARVVEEMTGIPVGDPEGADLERLAGLEDRLGKRVRGQDAAIAAVSEMIRRKRVGLADETKPPSALFFGPTGVGKTELAKALAEELFGDEGALVRLDMSEFHDRYQASRLVGAPPGYIGHEEGGQLTEAVRRRPYSVVLFDEIEKAHPQVLDVLLQVLDDGRLTDSAGQTVDFKETIIILTTNAGAGELLGGSSRPVGFAGVGEAPDVLGDEDAVKRALIGAGLRPEFVNRIGSICPFRPLSMARVAKIADGLLAKTARRLRERRGVELVEVEDGALRLLASGGYSAEHGVRHLAQYVQRTVDDRLTRMIAAGELKRGDELYLVVRDGQLVVEVEGPEDGA